MLDVKSLAAYARAEDLEFIALFGSQARGTARADSDYDLAVMPSRLDAPGDRVAVVQSLSASLHRGDLDAVWLPHASWVLSAEVARDGQVLFEQQPGVFARFCSAARLRSFDSQVWRARQMAGLRRILANDLRVNHDLVREKLTRLTTYLHEMTAMLDVERGVFVADIMRSRAAERNLELLVECAAAINSEVATGAGIPPSDYYSSFFSAAQAGWISHDTAQKLAPLASLRNVLVRAYERIDTRRLYDDLVRAVPTWKHMLLPSWTISRRECFTTRGA